jgi:hypothetical protein
MPASAGQVFLSPVLLEHKVAHVQVRRKRLRAFALGARTMGTTGVPSFKLRVQKDVQLRQRY